MNPYPTIFPNMITVYFFQCFMLVIVKANEVEFMKSRHLHFNVVSYTHKFRCGRFLSLLKTLQPPEAVY